MIGRPGRLVLLGRSLAHSRSPQFQNAALRAAGIPLTYELLDIPASALEDTLALLARARAAGNITVPYKEQVFARCDRVSEVAERAGAVNTFWFQHGELVGDNTDVAGFVQSVEQLLGGAPSECTIGVLGAGGAAAAVLTAISQWRHCRALLHNRTPDRAVALCARFSSVASLSDASGLARASDLVVNATTIGLRDDELPIAPDALRTDAAVLDLVYRQGETAWVRAARASGRRAADGLTMLVEQGAAAFERWFGFFPDRRVMWESLR
ncbi:MAG TPA: shikimate dehydrogenase [Gemmatimonadaceae bacterium]|nr:shikimate dehydrogenase [Gemmatimonadaceae bacterium]